MIELRHAFRQLLRAPVFTAAVLITLALATAAATTIFSVYNAVVLRPARVMSWDDVFAVKQASVVWRDIEPAQIRALRDGPPDTVTGIAARTWREVTIQQGQRAVATYAEAVEGDLASVFLIRPRVGRLLQAQDEAAGVFSVVISAGLWQRWFGSRPVLTGDETITINRLPFRVIGVMPATIESFFGPDVWISARALPSIDTARRPRFTWWWTYVRARPGVPVEELTRTINAAVKPARPESGTEGVRLYGGYRRANIGDVQVIGLAALLLIAATANVTNLVYARITQRRAEIAVRLAVGAGRWRIVRLFVTEIVVLTAVASAIGFLLASGATRLAERAFPTFRRDEWGGLTDLSPDGWVVLFAASASLLVAASLAVIVAASLGRIPAARALASAGGVTATGAGGRRFRSVLVGVQVTVAVVLVMGAGLWLVAARTQVDRMIEFSDFRFDAGRLASVRVSMDYQGYNDTRGADFLQRALAVARRVEGVEAAALASGIPGANAGVGSFAPGEISRPSPMYFLAGLGDRPLSGHRPAAQGVFASVSPGFLASMGLPTISGRDFTPADADGAPLVALISESVAAMLFPAGDPIGRAVVFNTDQKPRTIVGVFRDPLVSKQYRWMVPQNILVLVPMAQHYRGDAMIVLRSRAPGAVATATAAAVAALDPQLAIFSAASLEETVLAGSAPYRAITTGVTTLGALSLLFAALGIYGVMSFFVSTRVREFGIRLALGATPFTVMRHVYREARVLLLLGLLTGVFLMAMAERVLDNRIFRLAPNDISTWLLAIAVVLVTGLVAAYFPARRASRTDPTVALREL